LVLAGVLVVGATGVWLSTEGLDLPVVPLSEQQQKELDKQRAIQQQKIKNTRLGILIIYI
jgi:hypothetical protein